MIDKEAAELRRRLRPDRSNITKIHGCYINQFGEIVTTFDDSMAMLPVEEQEKYHELLKKAVSGTMGKTLSDVVFSTAQVQSSPEHGLLMKLRDSKLSDAEARKELYGKIAATVRLGENVGVLVLLACDTYDVPYRSGDGDTQADGGDTQFTYILCSICPVKEGRPSFRYDAAEQAFHNRGADWTVSAPELGFLFPAFDDRAANLYGALFYHRSKEDSYESFVEAVFHTRPPMTLGAQKDAFREVLVDSLENECSLSLVQTVHRELREAEHDAEHDDAAQEIGEDGCRAGFLEHVARAEEVTAADDAPEGDQLQVAVLEAPVHLVFVHGFPNTTFPQKALDSLLRILQTGAKYQMDFEKTRKICRVLPPAI